MTRLAWAFVLILLASPATAGDDTSCVQCHRDPDMMEDASWVEIVTGFATDVHAEVGLSCHDCHGGDPDPGVADDSLAAMDEGFAANPYRGAPARQDIPRFCGRCHSDPVYMKRFRPEAHVDQEERYWTSQHGKALRQGDAKVATCIDCHGVHGIRRSSEPDSKVYPTHVADTCGACHSDPVRMASYTLPDGSPLPVDQVERWKRSVHGHALIDREDLFAPTCNDCHGNHGATPPGHDSVALVCGQCHGREARLFRASPKIEGFTNHNELQLPEMTDGCGDCHEAPEPQAEITHIRSFSECVTCHGNHSVGRPTVALLGSLPEAPCIFCHEGPAGLDPDAGEAVQIRRNYEKKRNELYSEADSQGLTGDSRFDWLVDQALHLANHTLAGREGDVVLRPEFARLYEKFRIGKTHIDFVDPRTGEEVQEKLVQCTDCHGPEPVLASEGVGYRTSITYSERMHELMVASAQAERSLLRARRGGVEVKEMLLDLDQAVDRQIDLEVLVHGFTVADGSEFLTKQGEGMEHAHAALAGAQKALGELDYRRRGLWLSLIFVALVAVALFLKIRSLPG